MGRLLFRALEQSGLRELGERALSGAGLSEADMARIERGDLLLVAGLADAVREARRGDEVCVFGSVSALREAGVQLIELTLDPDGTTGAELLFRVALARLRTPAQRSLAVSFDALGLELAQTALAFGADALVGDLGSKRALPLLDGPEARRKELAGLIERAGRRVRFVEEARSQTMEQRS